MLLNAIMVSGCNMWEAFLAVHCNREPVNLCQTHEGRKVRVTATCTCTGMPGVER